MLPRHELELQSIELLEVDRLRQPGAEMVRGTVGRRIESGGQRLASLLAHLRHARQPTQCSRVPRCIELAALSEHVIHLDQDDEPDQATRVFGAVSFGHQTIERLTRLGRRIVAQLIVDNFQHGLGNGRIGRPRRLGRVPGKYNSCS